MTAAAMKKLIDVEELLEFVAANKAMCSRETIEASAEKLKKWIAAENKLEEPSP